MQFKRCPDYPSVLNENGIFEASESAFIRDALGDHYNIGVAGGSPLQRLGSWVTGVPGKGQFYTVEQAEPGIRHRRGVKVALALFGIAAAAVFPPSAAIISALATHLGLGQAYAADHDLELETEFSGNGFVHRLELLDNGSYLLRVEYTDPHADGAVSKSRIGARVPLSFPFYKGYVDVFGTDNSDNDSGLGVNLDGILNDSIIVGGAAERSVADNNVNRVLNLYSGIDLERLTLALGLADLQRGENKQTFYHGNLLGQFPKARLIGGLGGSIADSDGHAYFVLGQYPDKRGQGFGWRFSGYSDLVGDASLELILALKSDMGKTSFLIPFGRTEKSHEQRLRVVPNIMDYVIPPLTTGDRTANSAAFQINADHADGETQYNLAVAVFPVAMLTDSALFGNFWMQGEYNIGTETSTLFVGIFGGILGQFKIAIGKIEDQKICGLVGVNLNLNKR